MKVPTRKMVLLIFYFITTSVFADDYGSQFAQRLTKDNTASSLPMVYNDDINNTRLKINDANLIYTFEQIRRDQLPQIEQREENIGKYMYRKPKSTTTSMSTPVDSVLHEIHSLPHLPNFNPLVSPQSQRNYMSAYPSTIPPPPSTPEWEDLSVILKKQRKHQQMDKIPRKSKSDLYMQAHYFSHYHQHVPLLPSSETPFTQTPTQEIYIKQPLPNQSFSQMFQNQNIQFTTVRPAYAEMNHVVKHKLPQIPAIPQAPRLTASRGSHKFSWNDIVTPKLTTNTRSSTVDDQHHNNPPPVPTLSPWLDGYKK